MTQEEIDLLQGHSAMLGRIAAMVAPFCPEGETTTEEAVRQIIRAWGNETKWANHFGRRLAEAKWAGYLPDDFTF
jgi:hypothetical protein